MNAADRPPAPFLVGVGRSGTTLLRLMLDSHPELTIPPETHFVPELIEECRRQARAPEQLAELITSARQWGDFGLDREELTARLRDADPLDAGNALRAFYGLYAERAGKPRWGDKTPIYVESMPDIQSALPEARFVHLIRDGRDVALSRMRRALDKPPPVWRIAENWKRRIEAARRDAAELRRYLEVRYEDLVRDTEPTLRRVCELVELRFDPAMLDYHVRAEERLREMAGDLPARGGKALRPGAERLAAHALARERPRPERIGAWREEMSPDDAAAFEEAAGDLLTELGYLAPGGLAHD
jgi:Sulfotransferase family